MEVGRKKDGEKTWREKLVHSTSKVAVDMYPNKGRHALSDTDTPPN